MMETIVEYQNINKSFGPKVILDDFNLKVQKGENLTIIGGSGTGKSCSLKMLLALMFPDQGHILFRGDAVETLERKALRKMRSQVGMLFQGAALFDSMSIAENVAYPMREHLSLTEGEIRKRVEEKIDLVGLSGTEELFPADLSGGMRKRIALARAIAIDPKVILYDEPTTGLDPSNTRRINELIRRMQTVLKATSIIVTHDMDSAFFISDRIALLHNKKVAVLDSVENIKESKNQLLRDFISGHLVDR